MVYIHRRKEPFKSRSGRTALIAILKAPGDLAAARDHWYRIPLKNAPKHYFTHIAFYQPACFKPEGKRIVYYARVAGRATCRRIDLFPGEPAHPAANRFYLKYSLGRLIKLPGPILNTSGTRVVFGYAPLSRLKQAGDILAVFNTVPVENLMCAALKAAGLPFRREHVILHQGRVKYRLDFALFCKRGRLDIECDGRRFHGNPTQHAKDVYRDKWLKRHGWATLRFGEHEIYNDVEVCLNEINTAITFCGGLKNGIKCPWQSVFYKIHYGGRDMEPEERQVLHYTAGGKDLFGEWLDNLSDAAGRAAVRSRLNRVAEGNFGDYRGVGQGVWELRIHYGPGYRVYFGEDGPLVIILICGGDKRTQHKDIRKARRIWAEYRRLK